MTRTKKIAIAVALISTGSFMIAEPWVFPDEVREPVQEIVSEENSHRENPTPSPTPSVDRSPVEQNRPTESLTETEPVSPTEEITPPVEENPTEEATPLAPGSAETPDIQESEEIVISGYVDCSGNPQPCIDAGSLTYYAGNWSNGEWSQLIAGHDYMGYAWLNSVPTGTIVEVQGGPASGTYRVYDHMSLGRQGGDMPRFNGADLVLQSCQGSGTGFSLLEEL